MKFQDILFQESEEMIKAMDPRYREMKIKEALDDGGLSEATVYAYKTGKRLGSVSKKEYQKYLDEIGDDPVGAVDGKPYGFSGSIYMEESQSPDDDEEMEESGDVSDEDEDLDESYFFESDEDDDEDEDDDDESDDDDEDDSDDEDDDMDEARRIKKKSQYDKKTGRVKQVRTKRSSAKKRRKGRKYRRSAKGKQSKRRYKRKQKRDKKLARRSARVKRHAQARGRRGGRRESDDSNSVLSRIYESLDEVEDLDVREEPVHTDVSDMDDPGDFGIPRDDETSARDEFVIGSPIMPYVDNLRYNGEISAYLAETASKMNREDMAYLAEQLRLLSQVCFDLAEWFCEGDEPSEEDIEEAKMFASQSSHLVASSVKSILGDSEADESKKG